MSRKELRTEVKRLVDEVNLLEEKMFREGISGWPMKGYRFKLIPFRMLVLLYTLVCVVAACIVLVVAVLYLIFYVTLTPTPAWMASVLCVSILVVIGTVLIVLCVKWRREKRLSMKELRMTEVGGFKKHLILLRNERARLEKELKKHESISPEEMALVAKKFEKTIKPIVVDELEGMYEEVHQGLGETSIQITIDGYTICFKPTQCSYEQARQFIEGEREINELARQIEGQHVV